MQSLCLSVGEFLYNPTLPQLQWTMWRSMERSDELQIQVMIWLCENISLSNSLTSPTIHIDLAPLMQPYHVLSQPTLQNTSDGNFFNQAWLQVNYIIFNHDKSSSSSSSWKPSPNYGPATWIMFLHSDLSWAKSLGRFNHNKNIQRKEV